MGDGKDILNIEVIRYILYVVSRLKLHRQRRKKSVHGTFIRNIEVYVISRYVIARSDCNDYNQ